MASFFISFSILLNANPSGVTPNTLKYLNNDLILLILSWAESYAYNVTVLSVPAPNGDVPRKDICTRMPVVIDAACATATADVIAFSNLVPDIEPDASIEMWIK